MLTYILPLEGGGLCVCILVYLFFFTVADEASIECWWILPWNAHRHNKTGMSFNPRAATDISGSVKTCLWLDDWQDGVRSRLSRDRSQLVIHGQHPGAGGLRVEVGGEESPSLSPSTTSFWSSRESRCCPQGAPV